MDYRDAGVVVEAGRAVVDRIRDRVQRTFRPEVLGGLGGVGGCFEIPAVYTQPGLVSGTDGVGTKLKLAHALGIHHTVGIDLVAMCVNDVLTSGAEPLFFLDYVATGKLDPEDLANVVDGIATGCEESGCALLGGETAEMPGFYGAGEYDLAGFCVGIVEKSKILDGSKVTVGDVAIALPSSGIHSNGFSLVRKIVANAGLSWDDSIESLGEATLGQVLLTPTHLYVKPILALLKSGIDIHSMGHVTGGGLPENLPRCLQDGQGFKIQTQSWQPLPVFDWLESTGNVDRPEMFNTFNMGVGFVMVVPADSVNSALEILQQQNTKPWVIGEVVSGNRTVELV